MKLSSSNLAVLALLAVAALGAAFWMLGLSPKREEAGKLEKQADQAKASLAQHQAEITAAEEAREEFPVEYQRLVVLGKAVPGDDDTASLLVQVNRIADRAGISFRDLELSSEGASETEATEATPVASSAEGTPVSPTEAAAATMPLGATIGPAGLGVMPYNLTFDGSFFEIADFIKGLDTLVDTGKEDVTVDGRLLTIDGFSLKGATKAGFPQLEANFVITTYLTPPGLAPTAGAAPETPATTEATPAATTTGVAK
jgi:Tfp pilus assembly protein PilO